MRGIATRASQRTRHATIAHRFITCIGAVTAVAIMGCATATHTSTRAAPAPCQYRVTRAIAHPTSGSVRHDAVIHAIVTDTARRPIADASVARMPGGPGVFTDASGEATIRLSQRDLARTDSISIVVRRVGNAAIPVPVQAVAGDSITIEARMCPGGYWLSESPPAAVRKPVDHTVAGTGIGAVLGAAIGFLFERSHCDRTPSRRCNPAPSVIGGAAIGAVLGYIIGRLVSHGAGACLAPGPHPETELGYFRRLVRSTDPQDTAFRHAIHLPVVPDSEIHVVTDEAVCAGIVRTWAADDSALGVRKPYVTQRYVIAIGHVYVAYGPFAYGSHYQQYVVYDERFRRLAPFLR